GPGEGPERGLGDDPAVDPIVDVREPEADRLAVDLGLGEPVGDAFGDGDRRPDLLHRLRIAAAEYDLDGVAGAAHLAQLFIDAAHCSVSRWRSRAARRPAQ